MTNSQLLSEPREILTPELLDSLLEGVAVHDSQGRVVYANATARRLLGLSTAVMATRELIPGDWDLLGSDGLPMPLEQWPVSRILAGANEVRGQLLGFRTRHGERAIWLTANAIAREIRGSRHVVVTFAESTAAFGFRFRDVVESSRDIVLITDTELAHGGPRIVYANPAFSRLTGYSLDEAIGQPPSLLQGPDTSPETRREIREALAAGMPIRTTILNYSKAGQPYWLDIQICPIHDRDGRITHFAAFERDMSDAQAELERAMYAATHDPLTDALNRRGFIALCEPMQARCRREAGVNALMTIDIDHFKAINDRFGHAEGDRVLKDLADTVKRRLRETDVFARLGGEEFAIFASVNGAATGISLAESIRLLVESRITAGPQRAPVTVSIGVHASDGHEPLDGMMSKADAQLYLAKAGGRNRVMHAMPDAGTAC